MDDARPLKRARTGVPQGDERSFAVPATLTPGTRVEVFHRRPAVAMGWCAAPADLRTPNGTDPSIDHCVRHRYAAEVRSVDAELLEVQYVGCSPGQSVEWICYTNNHDLAFLPSKPAAADTPAVSASSGNGPVEMARTDDFGTHDAGIATTSAAAAAAAGGGVAAAAAAAEGGAASPSST